MFAMATFLNYRKAPSLPALSIQIWNVNGILGDNIKSNKLVKTDQLRQNDSVREALYDSFVVIAICADNQY